MVTSEDDYLTCQCPCEPYYAYTTPPFVGNDYFCETVATGIWDEGLFSDNALWDGQDLLNQCYGLNNPPWFHKTLPTPTTDDIEVRLCFNNEADDIAVELLEVYIM